MASARVGLAHDYLLVMRGAERTFSAIASCWPGAPVYTLLYDEDGTDGRLAAHPVVTSPLQRLRIAQNGFRAFLPVLPAAAEAIRPEPHDALVTSSSAFAHGISADPATAHVVYCHSPFRYAWHEIDRAVGEAPRPVRPVMRRALERIRRWDLKVSARVDHYIANSEITRRRIADFYGRDSNVIHPPVEVERFRPGVPEDFFLVVCELVRHKRANVALEAARLARVPIKVVGGGPELEQLRSAYPEAEFLGRVGDAELADLYTRARALVVPNVEEFGIAAVEAQAAGRPVIGTDEGGTSETVVPGETGVLVPCGDVVALAEAMRFTDFHAFDAERIADNAARFSTDVFRGRIAVEVEALTGVPAPAHATGVPASASA